MWTERLIELQSDRMRIFAFIDEVGMQTDEIEIIDVLYEY